MEISSEASVTPFSIGPSTIVGRTIALRVLFCKSASRFRHQVLNFVWFLFFRFRESVLPLVSWFHPRNPQGILVLITVIAFVLRRYTNVRLRARSVYKRKFWRNMMRSAVTYEEWSHAAKMLDQETPKMSKSDLYDEELVKYKLKELRDRRRQGSLRDIIFCMRVDLLRNLGNMCNPDLHKGRLQVPRLIKEYIDEVSTQLRMVCDSDSEELLLEEKLAFMHETRHAFGRTALLLSGGASLGSFHVGVVKTLVENKLLPRIVAGSSVGSIMCAIVATRSRPELESFFEDKWHSLQFFDQMGGIFTVVRRIMTQGALHDIRQLQRLLRNLTGNLTFQEAFDMTGRILGITVCSPRKHEPPRCLNYLTSPHVVIWSAVTASCAFPGLFEAQELMAKDRSGELVPFQAPFEEGYSKEGADKERTGKEGTNNYKEGSGTKKTGNSSRRWRDGSLESDLPMKQLKELFNVNHFIVSQANPHIAPFLRLKELVRAYGGNFAAKLAHLAEMEVKHRCNQILELGFPLGGLAKLFAQEWEGDVTVVMPATLAQYSKIIQNPSYMELQKAANQGRRCTWEKLSAIKANCSIELVLDECVALLNHMRRLKRRDEQLMAASSHGLSSTVRFNASRRIPSWNCIARENSAGSLEDDLADVAASLYQGDTHFHPAGRNLPLFRGKHDGSESESESSELHSWTRSGGPLMRTTSAHKFMQYVQSLELDVGGSTPLMGEAALQHINTNATEYLAEHISTCSSPAGGGSFDYENLRKVEGNLDFDTEVSSRVSTGSSSTIVVAEGDLLQPERTRDGIVFNIVKKDVIRLAAEAGTSPVYTGVDGLSPSPTVESLELMSSDKDADLFDASQTSESGEEDVSNSNFASHSAREVCMNESPFDQADN